MSQHRHERSGRCERLLQQLMAYVDDELSPARCREIERHLAACECCGTMADNVRAVVALCRSDRGTPVPTALRARARARMRALLVSASGRDTGAAPAPAAVRAPAATPASPAAGGAALARGKRRRPATPRTQEARPATKGRRVRHSRG